MGRNVFPLVLALTAAVLAIALLLPAGQVPVKNNLLPWQVEHTADGHTRVFGLIPGASSVADADKLLDDRAEVTLFAKPNGTYSVEAYFDRLDLAGLGARMVLTVTVDQATLAAMYNRGIRVSTMSGGTKRVTLYPDDLQKVRHAPIGSITYLPLVKLDGEAISRRFGKPWRRIREVKDGAEHWLYPSLGLDVALNQRGKDVFQYVSPDRFNSLIVVPLLKHGKPIEDIKG